MHSEHTILSKRQLSEEVYRMEILAPLVARERMAGQFVIVQYDQKYSERIPLTIADADPVKGSVTVIFQTVGASTHKLALKNVGDSIVLLGPLGNPPISKNTAGLSAWRRHRLAASIVKALKEAGTR